MINLTAQEAAQDSPVYAAVMPQGQVTAIHFMAAPVIRSSPSMAARSARLFHRRNLGRDNRLCFTPLRGCRDRRIPRRSRPTPTLTAA